MAKKATAQVVSVEGHRLKVSSLDKVLYPATGTTKADVLRYYAQIAPVLIPHTTHRPATRKRWVHGVGTADAPGAVFFQKDIGGGVPEWVPRAVIEHSDGPKTYPLVDNSAVLAWLAQIAALEIHVPQWRFSHDGERRNPDRLVLDLDPGEGTGLSECVEVARIARGILTDMGLDPMPVTSGSKGIHLYAAIDGRQTSDQVSAVAHELARALEADHPDLIVSDMKKSLRTGKVLVDWSQNNGSKTTIAPYSLRGRLRPSVAAPRTWEELDSPSLAQLEFEEVLERVARSGDPAAGIEGAPPTATDAEGRERITAAPIDDRLATYRSMRDASKTPEPVPAERAVATEGRSFVIQEHHARRLHYDFRLERDGVLVSWALPRGVPTDAGRNHLAVQTEDHPLAYGTFEGTIPGGEYGAGTVSIWDAGTYELEKWRDDEVIATLHGEAAGGLGEPVRVALIRTSRGASDGKSQWLIHRMKDQKRPEQEREYPSSQKPAAHEAMLARPGTLDALDAGTEWAVEMKWDGIRALVAVRDGHVSLVTRNGIDVTPRYPEITAAAAAFRPATGVYDGEIVAPDASGRPDFGLLQERMGLTKPAEVRVAAARRPVRLFLFDALEVDGESIVRLPYRDRRERLLESIVQEPNAVIVVPDAFDGDAAAALETSRTLGLEGVMAKDASSRYEEGRRSGAWVKIKHTTTQEVVIGGWRPGKGRRAATIGSLLVGIPGPSGLDYVGRVGTGFSDGDLERITEALRSLSRSTSPFVDVPAAESRDAQWVRASIVGEVEFGEWTRSGVLRHPVWRGLRPDKNPEQVLREEPAAQGEG